MLTINQKYPYKELKRTEVDGKRLYQNPYGDPVPSVTTILSATPVSYTHLTLPTTPYV